MAFCERLSEQLAVIAVIDPVVLTAAVAVDSTIFSMALHRRALFILQTGATVNAPGVLVQIREGATVNMTATTTAVILTGLAAAVTAAASQFLFEVSGEAMTDGWVYLNGRITPGAGPTAVNMIALADVERYHPASDRDIASVVSIQYAN